MMGIALGSWDSREALDKFTTAGMYIYYIQVYKLQPQILSLDPCRNTPNPPPPVKCISSARYLFCRYSEEQVANAVVGSSSSSATLHFLYFFTLFILLAGFYTGSFAEKLVNFCFLGDSLLKRALLVNQIPLSKVVVGDAIAEGAYSNADTGGSELQRALVVASDKI